MIIVKSKSMQVESLPPQTDTWQDVGLFFFPSLVHAALVQALQAIIQEIVPIS